MKVGILALQGDVDLHRSVLESLKVQSVLITSKEQLDDVRRLIIPGGESTAMSKLLVSSDIYGRLKERIEQDSISIFGTCAGLILLSNTVLDGRQDQVSLQALDVSVRRNAFGRQIESSFKHVEMVTGGFIEPAFIRAPKIENVSTKVDILGRLKDSGEPVLVRQGKMMGATFHPELCFNQDCNMVPYSSLSHNRNGNCLLDLFN